MSMKGKRVELGSRLALGNVAAADSHLMRRFRTAGLVTLGRTASPEFAYSTTTEPVLHGAARNPWDLSRTPGGPTPRPRTGPPPKPFAATGSCGTPAWTSSR